MLNSQQIFSSLNKLEGAGVSSKYKHFVNQILCDSLATLKGRPLRILETHQGLGDATVGYRLHGCVISFEIDRDTHGEIRKRFHEAFSLEACLEHDLDLLKLAQDYGKEAGYPVVIPSRPMDARLGLSILNNRKCRFDVIDVDPYGSPRDFIPEALDMLDRDALFLVTTGEMHYVRFRPHDAISKYDVRADDSLKPTQTFFRQDNILIMGSQTIESALERSIALYPIFIYDYYTGHAGVQRIGYFAKREATLLQKIEAKRQIAFDPVLGARVLRCSFQDNRIEVPWRFSDDALNSKIQEFVVRRLHHIVKTLKA